MQLPISLAVIALQSSHAIRRIDKVNIAGAQDCAIVNRIRRSDARRKLARIRVALMRRGAVQTGLDESAGESKRRPVRARAAYLNRKRLVDWRESSINRATSAWAVRAPR